MVSRKLRASKTKKQASLQAYCMLAPQMIGLAVFTILPILWVIRLSFFEFNGFQSDFIGFDNFVRAFTRDPYYWRALLNTIVISFGKLLVEIPLALVCAVLLNGKLRGSSLYRTVFFMPSVMSPAIIGLVFCFLFSGYNGIINSILVNTGVIHQYIDWFGTKLTANAVIMITSVWQNFGLNMLFFLTGLQTIPKELYECADIDGAGPVKRFFKITLPLLAPMTKIILLLAIIGSMKVTDLVLVLTNGQPGGQTEVIMTYIYKQFFTTGSTTTMPEYGYASALGVITAIILGIITLIYVRVTRDRKGGEDA